jgi:uncharacterized repeat protein (TIGR02543 family)
MRKITLGAVPLIALGLVLLVGIQCGDDKSTNNTCYTLTVTAQGSGGTDIQPRLNCYADTTHIRLTAEPDTGWGFDNWSGDLTGSDNPTTITLTKNTSITANFTEVEYTLTVNITPALTGVVTRDPNQTTYHYNDVVTLTATPSSNYEFASWTGDASGTTASIDVTIDGDMTITANFEHIVILESEPDCATNYLDEFNAGCNISPPVFSSIDNDQIIDGRSGTYLYFDALYRDTDWYQYTSVGNGLVELQAAGDFYLQIYIINDVLFNCDSLVILTGDTALPGDTAYTSAYIEAGRYYVWIGPAEFSGWPCPTDYRLWFNVETTAGAQKTLPPMPQDRSKLSPTQGGQ